MQAITVGKAYIDGQLLRKHTDLAMVRFTDKKARQLKKLAKLKVGRRTGKLRRSIDLMDRKYVPGIYYSVSVGSRVKYAYPHHEGTEPYIIRPKTRKVLKFKAGSVVAMGRTDGRGNVYARAVRHPRVAPNRYLTDPAKIIFTGRR
jgi:hypothetical protein